MNMEFKVGTSKVDITPNYGSPTRRWSAPDDRARITDIRWPLYARTVAISDGECLTTITSMEIACLYKCHHDHIRALVREMSPVPIDHVILHNTHQHSDSFIEYESAYDQFDLAGTAFDMDYIQGLPRKIATSICLAVQRLTPAVAGHASGAIEEGIASCRRMLTEDGQLAWRGSRPPPDARALPRGHIDPDVGVLAFSEPSGKPLATLYNYACHPSAAGGDSPSVVTADYPGYASDIIEKSCGGLALFLHGCSGDINPGKYVRGSNSTEDRIADAMRMGKLLAGESLKTLALIKSEKVVYFNSARKETTLPVHPAAGNRDECLENARNAVARWRADKNTDPRLALRKYAVSLKIENGACPVTLGAVAVNNVNMAFIPGEPFTEYGEKIKRASNADMTLVAGTWGEDPFYIPTPEAIEQGGYESSYIADRDTGNSLLEQVNNLMLQIQRQ